MDRLFYIEELIKKCNELELYQIMMILQKKFFIPAIVSKKQLLEKVNYTGYHNLENKVIELLNEI